MAFLRLHGTPLSHFTRKIRILLSELSIDYEFVRSPSVLSPVRSAYAENPLRRVPVLIDECVSLIDSEHIARYLVGKHDPFDRLNVCSNNADDLNRLAVANGIMDNEVVLLLTQRTGGDVRSTYCQKLVAAATDGLAWLDAQEVTDSSFVWSDIATICMWQHLEHSKLLELEPHCRLASRMANLATRPAVAATTPEVSLIEAAAAGWKPL